MFNIHKKTETEKDKFILQKLIIRQTVIVSKHNFKLTCGACSKTFDIVGMYKCLYCGIWFCRRCAKIHFENNGE